MSPVKSSQSDGIPLDKTRPSNLMGASFTKNPNVHWTSLDSESVLVNLETGFYYTLNPVASAIWAEFAKGTQPKEILSEICNRFDVDAGVAQDDLITLITRLNDDGIIELLGGGSDEARP